MIVKSKVWFIQNNIFVQWTLAYIFIQILLNIKTYIFFLIQTFVRNATDYKLFEFFYSWKFVVFSCLLLVFTIDNFTLQCFLSVEHLLAKNGYTYTCKNRRTTQEALITRKFVYRKKSILVKLIQSLLFSEYKILQICQFFKSFCR